MIYIIKKIKIKFKILYLKIKHRLDNADIQVLRLPEIPYRGICPICKEKVYHAYPWWTGNPDKPESKPLHNGCHAIFLGWE